MPEAVVDVLEAVEVEEQHREEVFLIASPAALDRASEVKGGARRRIALGAMMGLDDFDVPGIRAKHPRRLMEEAVRGMLPKSKLGDAMYRKLNVYEGGEHPHAAQKPVKIEVA